MSSSAQDNMNQSLNRKLHQFESSFLHTVSEMVQLKHLPCYSKWSVIKSLTRICLLKLYMKMSVDVHTGLAVYSVFPMY